MGKRKLLVICNGAFSGITASLLAALSRNGCEVVVERNSLRRLNFRFVYLLFMILNAIIVYDKNYRKYMHRTYAAFMAYSKCNATLVKMHDDIDAVLLVGANSLNCWGGERLGVAYFVFTDHVNILSKVLPAYGYEIPEKQIYGRWNELEKRALRQQDHVFVMGSQVKDVMIGYYGVEANKVTVVGGGPNLDLDIERDVAEKNYQGKNILFVGMDHERKGLSVLLKAFERVIDEQPAAKLHIVGVRGEVARGIRYYGRLQGEPLKKLFYEAQVFALPTYREPFGIVFLEAMFAKAVCIGTDIGAIPEIIADKATGLITKPGNADELASGIVCLLSDTAMLKQMAERAYERAKSKWTWDRTASMMLEQMGQGGRFGRYNLVKKDETKNQALPEKGFQTL